jgi:hypothetical protein
MKKKKQLSAPSIPRPLCLERPPRINASTSTLRPHGQEGTRLPPRLARGIHKTHWSDRSSEKRHYCVLRRAEGRLECGELPYGEMCQISPSPAQVLTVPQCTLGAVDFCVRDTPHARCALDNISVRSPSIALYICSTPDPNPLLCASCVSPSQSFFHPSPSL